MLDRIVGYWAWVLFLVLESGERIGEASVYEEPELDEK